MCQVVSKNANFYRVWSHGGQIWKKKRQNKFLARPGFDLGITGLQKLCSTTKLLTQHYKIMLKSYIILVCQHNQCSFDPSYCHLKFWRKFWFFSKISHWISIFSVITIYSYHIGIPEELKIAPYLFWVKSPILDSVILVYSYVQNRRKERNWYPMLVFGDS